MYNKRSISINNFYNRKSFQIIMELAKLFDYKIWSDNIYLDYCDSLTDEQLRKNICVYKKSIRDILEHICEVTWFWFEFITTKKFENPPDFKSMSSKELSKYLVEQNKRLQEYISKEDLNKEFIIQWNEGDKPVQSTAENILFNLVTHNAYHRGQIAIFLRILGFEEIKETDFNPYIYQIGQK